MGDECNCEKCQATSVVEKDESLWPVVREEVPARGRGALQSNLYLVVTDGGISLLQQSHEM
jgi:hypothetical protein